MEAVEKQTVAIPFGSRELSNKSMTKNRTIQRRNPFRIQGTFKPQVRTYLRLREVAIPFGSRELSNIDKKDNPKEYGRNPFRIQGTFKRAYARAITALECRNPFRIQGTFKPRFTRHCKRN